MANKSDRFTIRIDSFMQKGISTLATELGTTNSDVARLAIWGHLVSTGVMEAVYKANGVSANITDKLAEHRVSEAIVTVMKAGYKVEMADDAI